jgi:nuclear pore complex protein Nup155
MPLQIQDDLKREDICASFMGILPEINRVWVTIDNVIYFWNYMSDVRDDLLIYEGLSEVVYSVTLVTTKPDTFTDMVAYLLVVVTPVEVCLLAVIRDDNEGPMGREASDFSLQSIQPTKYSTPSDNMTFFCVAGTSSGRIFMAASDNNVYEFQYSNEESSWMHYLGIGSDFSCKKKRHAPARENSFSNLFSIFGGTDDKLVDLVVDEPRKLLYSISKTGNLSLFYLESESAPVPIQTVNIMSKARNIRSKVLKSDDIAVNVFVVSAEESAQIHGVVVLASGVRVFFTVHGYGSDLYFGPQSATSNKKPRGLDIAYIRQPPKETVFLYISLLLYTEGLIWDNQLII